MKAPEEGLNLIPAEQKIEILVFGSEELIGHGYNRLIQLANFDEVFDELVDVSINNPIAAKGAIQAYGVLKGIKYIKYFPALLNNFHDQRNMYKALERTASDAMVDGAVSFLLSSVAGLPVLPCYVVVVGGNLVYVGADRSLQYLENHEFKIGRKGLYPQGHWDLLNTDYNVDPAADLKVLLIGVKGICYLPHLAHSGLSYIQDRVYEGLSKRSSDVVEVNGYRGLRVPNQQHFTGFQLRSNSRTDSPIFQPLRVGVLPIEKPKFEAELVTPTYTPANLRIPLSAFSGQPVNPLHNLGKFEEVHSNSLSPFVSGGGMSLHNNTKDGMPQWFAYVNVDPRIGIPIFVGYLLKDDIRYIVNYAIADANKKPGMHLLRAVQKLNLAVKDDFHYFNLAALWNGQEAHIHNRKLRLDDAIKQMEDHYNDNPGAKLFLASVRYGLKTRDTSDFLDTFYRSYQENNFSSFTEGYRAHHTQLINQFEAEKSNLVAGRKISQKLLDDFPQDPTSFVVQAFANRDDPILAEMSFEQAFKVANKKQRAQLDQTRLAFYSTQYKESKGSILWRTQVTEAAKEVASSGQSAADMRTYANEILVNVYSDEGHFKKAIKCQEQLCELNKTSINYYNLACLRLANLESQSGGADSVAMPSSKTQCIEDLLSSLSCDPKNRGSLRLIGSLLYEEKNYSSAAEYYDRCAEYYPDDIEACIGSASAHYHDNNFDAALKNAINANKLNPLDHRSSLLAALCYMEKGDLNEAKKYIAECKKLKPDDPTIKLLESTIQEIEAKKTNEQIKVIINISFNVIRLCGELDKLASLRTIYELLQNYKVYLPIPNLSELNALAASNPNVVSANKSSSSHSVIVNRAAIPSQQNNHSSISALTDHSFIVNRPNIPTQHVSQQGVFNQVPVFKF